MAIKVTKGNVNDRTPVTELTKKLKGSIYADKGYFGAGLFKALYKKGLRLITGIRKNMKNYLSPHLLSIVEVNIYSLKIFYVALI